MATHAVKNKHQLADITDVNPIKNISESRKTNIHEKLYTYKHHSTHTLISEQILVKLMGGWVHGGGEWENPPPITNLQPKNVTFS